MKHVHDDYRSVAKALHWTIALLIITNYVMGLTLDDTSWYSLHIQIGFTILLLVVLRVIWRLSTNYPNPLESISKGETLAARLGQILLYFLMFAVPLSGILMVEAKGHSISIYGLIPVPVVIDKQPHAIAHVKTIWHLWLAHTIIIIAAGHGLIALVHHFINKDRLLVRMLPFGKRSENINLNDKK